ncbi:hypothetical protein KFE25_008044 [Diacronema lutheri]|uniref:Uncharacterized protein n=1 Tax=Diacronema lutheri TaxID=2081491 RepID=A0A8J5XRN5_DIALT|nr:hypothetical protein KFE25_008044 [Diacronema lutheri]|mmetsp:Transcript_3145/g.9769  ORF Transcript_3145/g.9769 Transcript_3145/m.9769 type:complete len:147 (-) Transcript_3145:365-805(-)
MAFSAECTREQDKPIVLHLQDGAVVLTHLSTLRSGAVLAERAEKACEQVGGAHLTFPDMTKWAMMVVMNYLRGQSTAEIRKTLRANTSSAERERVLRFAREHGLDELAACLSSAKPRALSLPKQAQHHAPAPHPVHVLDSIRQRSS